MTKSNKQILIDLKIQSQKEKYPSFPEHAIPQPKYTDATANGLTTCIKDFLNLTGHQAERISSSGRVIRGKDSFGIYGEVYKGETKYIPSTSTNGTADISATIKGKSVKIEVKIGNDRQSEAQKKYQYDVERAGGIYYIATDFDSFMEWYKKNF